MSDAAPEPASATTTNDDAGGLLDNATPVDPKAAAQADPQGDSTHRAEDALAKSTEPAKRPEFIPEKFWDKDKNEPRLEAMAKSYAEMEKNFKLGKHKPPDGGKYDLTPLNGKVKDDDPVVGAYTEWAAKHGLSQAAFEELATKVVEIGQQGQEAAQLNRKAELEKLGEHGSEMIDSLVDWARGRVNSGVWSQEDFEEFKIWGGSASGVRALMKLRESYEGRIPLRETMPQGDGAISDEELNAMVGKPEYSSDPAFRAKVTRMFEQRYGKGVS